MPSKQPPYVPALIEWLEGNKATKGNIETHPDWVLCMSDDGRVRPRVIDRLTGQVIEIEDN